MKARITICTGVPKDGTPGSGSWMGYGFTDDNDTPLYVNPGPVALPDLSEAELNELPIKIAEWIRNDVL